MKSQKGFSLVEVLVALAILGIAGTAFLFGLATASEALVTTDERETAKNLAESQMEYIKDLDYAASYTPGPIPDEYAGYQATIDVAPISSRDGNIQKIVVTIEHHDQEVLTLEGYKVNK